MPSNDNDIRILILEELVSEMMILQSILSDAGIQFSSKNVKTEKEFIRIVNRFKPDVIISGKHFSKLSFQDCLTFTREQNLY
ncbi:MAG: response regulator [Bacteroidetes bacterium]|nr:MAG: response regulator [Bacteroidota bacterium]REK00937.1 MAG: response regulator [Bacteroidota bacterium]REK34540.1 MAG: response regulator [Bacteroidota bacterium]REK51798.1 MAG: response regulator [Bacteroidota bacterium]